MKLRGTRTLNAPPEIVWAKLIDPQFLGALIPGCRSMTGNVDSGYDVTVERQLANATIRMTGRFDLSDIEPGRGALLTGRGEGGGMGGASGTCRIALAPEGEGTLLTWTIEAALEGRLAAMPDWVVNLAAQKVANGFTERFAAAVEQREPAQKKGWLGRITGG